MYYTKPLLVVGLCEMQFSLRRSSFFPHKHARITPHSESRDRKKLWHACLEIELGWPELSVMAQSVVVRCHFRSSLSLSSRKMLIWTNSHSRNEKWPFVTRKICTCTRKKRREFFCEKSCTSTFLFFFSSYLSFKVTPLFPPFSFKIRKTVGYKENGY